MSDAMRTASNGLQMAQGQLNTAAVGLAEATLPMQPETVVPHSPTLNMPSFKAEPPRCIR
ncbi:MAG: hypothetical protein R2857_14895 [Vampirovibrionales bacterium]